MFRLKIEISGINLNKLSVIPEKLFEAFNPNKISVFFISRKLFVFLSHLVKNISDLRMGGEKNEI